MTKKSPLPGILAILAILAFSFYLLRWGIQHKNAEKYHAGDTLMMVEGKHGPEVAEVHVRINPPDTGKTVDTIINGIKLHGVHINGRITFSSVSDSVIWGKLPDSCRLKFDTSPFTGWDFHDLKDTTIRGMTIDSKGRVREIPNISDTTVSTIITFDPLPHAPIPYSIAKKKNARKKVFYGTAGIIGRKYPTLTGDISGPGYMRKRAVPNNYGNSVRNDTVNFKHTEPIYDGRRVFYNVEPNQRISIINHPEDSSLEFLPISSIDSTPLHDNMDLGTIDTREVWLKMKIDKDPLPWALNITKQTTIHILDTTYTLGYGLMGDRFDSVYKDPIISCLDKPLIEMPVVRMCWQKSWEITAYFHMSTGEEAPYKTYTYEYIFLDHTPVSKNVIVWQFIPVKERQH